MNAEYRVHRFDIDMNKDPEKLEQYLNNLKGEVIAIIPNITLHIPWKHRINFLLIVEKIT